MCFLRVLDYLNQCRQISSFTVWTLPSPGGGSLGEFLRCREQQGGVGE